MSEVTRGYWVDAPGRGSLRAAVLPARPGGDALRLRALYTGISPGTERLVGLGRVPESCGAAMACRGMQGTFALPVLYGYSFVGEVEHGQEAGRRAFVMRPHQQCAVVRAAEAVWLPDSIPSARATLFPNLETARNGVWDAQLTGTERVAVIGAGAVGLLLAFVLAREHRGEVCIVEQDEDRRRTALALPWIDAAIAPAEVEPGSFGHALHATGGGAGLQLGIDAVGFEGQVTDLSWYGDRTVSLRLGESFHHQRKRIAASQVASIAPDHRRQGHAARTAAVLELLQHGELDRLLGEPIAFDELPRAFAELYSGKLAAPCPVVGY